MGLIDDAAPSFRRIFAEVIRIRLDHCQASVETVREAASLFESVTATKYLMALDIRPTGEPGNVSMTVLPVEICDWVDDSAALDQYLRQLAESIGGESQDKTTIPGDLSADAQRFIRIGARAFSNYYAAGGVNSRFMEAANAQIDAEQDVLPLVAGLVMVGSMGIAMTAAALGTTPQDVLGGMVAPLVNP